MNLSSHRKTRIGPWLRIKWAFFRQLERLSDLRGNNTRGQLSLTEAGPPCPALWVFVSTIGELNAIEPWLRQLTQGLPTQRLVLITDHAHYRASYEARYPSAVVCVSHGHHSDAAALGRQYPPDLLVVAEIPCLPSDAPCRFSMAFVIEAKRRQAAAVIINGWLYGYTPACRMDGLERRLFGRDFLRAFDMICVQTREAANQLILAGAEKSRLAITGNIKFDAMTRTDWRPELAHSPHLLKALLDAARPVVVAGCVTSEAEQNAVLDAFCIVKTIHADALLVLAPRHPEVQERMLLLRQLLDQRGLTTQYRSAIGQSVIPTGCDCLVLDTMGDLRDFYAAAKVAHVGVDHNVLEPLGFERAVTVMPGWNTTYPSFPVYQILVEEDALLLATDAASLAAHWLSVIAAGELTHPARARAALKRASGAVERHFTAVLPWIEPMRNPNDAPCAIDTRPPARLVTVGPKRATP